MPTESHFYLIGYKIESRQLFDSWADRCKTTTKHVCLTFTMFSYGWSRKSQDDKPEVPGWQKNVDADGFESIFTFSIVGWKTDFECMHFEI